jgi:hypothetical protein
MSNSGKKQRCDVCDWGLYDYVAPDYLTIREPYYKCRTCGDTRGELEDE